MDGDHDGLVNLEEFTQFLKHFLGEEVVSAKGGQVHEIFTSLDQDHDGKLNLKGEISATCSYLALLDSSGGPSSSRSQLLVLVYLHQ